MPSPLLDELCHIRDLYNTYVQEPASFIDEYSPARFDTISFSGIFIQIKDHVDECKSCYGLSLAVNSWDHRYRDVDEENNGFCLTCSCGHKWRYPSIYLKIQYKGTDLEDLVARINWEIMKSNARPSYKPNPHRIGDIQTLNVIPKIFRNAISSLEIS